MASSASSPTTFCAVTLAVAANRSPWIKDLVDQIQAEVLARRDWVGITALRATDSECHEQARGPIRLLDYACGSGELSRTLFPHMDEVRGIDLSSAMVKAYNDMAVSANVQKDSMLAVQGDILGPPTGSQRDAFTGREWFDFDMAVMSMALHHVASPEDAVKLLVERLRTGGIVLLIDWVLDSVRFSGADLTKHAHDVAPGSENTMTRAGFGKDEMLGILDGAGCQDVGFLEFEEPTRLGDGEQAMMQRLFIAKGRKMSSD
ncbi:MAG: hypothetical protein LQ350_006668 [Teloschistes chrysophthalmus]|nr:MAG: hypothetical protein LQ350_006668 [Niorma chrysophthalma]